MGEGGGERGVWVRVEVRGCVGEGGGERGVWVRVEVKPIPLHQVDLLNVKSIRGCVGEGGGEKGVWVRVEVRGCVGERVCG